VDTGTHLVIGLGLAGLAHADPAVAADPALATAIAIGAVLGSQAPDLDGLLRFHSNAVYIKNHRGLSHSLPALLIWTILITGGIYSFFQGVSLLHLGLWVFGAVVFHVFTDLFNTYGTQAARPLSEKWISWNIIHIFDPFIFSSHLVALSIWALQLESPAVIFPVLYAVIAVYYVWRTLHHYVLETSLRKKDSDFHPGDKFYLIPTVNLNIWNVVKSRQNGTYMLGELKHDRLKWIDKASCSTHPAVEASKSHPDIAAFLYFSSFACAEVKETLGGYEVRWADIRYRHRKQYPFVAVLRMDADLNPLHSYVGWKSESRLEKKLGVDPS
jgi:inner membrane protein